MQQTKVWQEQVELKTYLTGSQDPHPIFLEHRVYQGSSGAVYPYGVTDTLQDKVEMRSYTALFLENDYLKVMILPELGGRVQRAYDKVNKRDFVYYNQVVKPALVGLLGPWISGGIEFNWPQHHRPTTYMPVDFSTAQNADGSATVFVGEREPMHGLSVTTAFTLFPDKARLHIKSRVFNTTDTAKSFLWWSNPAVKGGDQHQSVFPPDVTAVFDHGKRAVIDFPIAHGEYYKVKYDGVDISRYKNLPVPTSYMAWRSDYDFVGAYCHDEQGGLLHVADHHIAPGKKQWTWGYGDFGQAWDRNLTDEDGPYIELMTGVYTDNQPDFTWLEPGEEKEYEQNFLPYCKLGTLQNACEKAALKMERDGGSLKLGVYAVEPLSGLVEVTTEDGREIDSRAVYLTPCCAELWELPLQENCPRLKVSLKDSNGGLILEYVEHIAKPTPLPETAPNPPQASEVKSADEAYFIGQHLEQYHHATRSSEAYYKRALEIDPLDYRCNTALGSLELNRANYEAALTYAENALKRAHMLNRNPACGLGSIVRATALLKLGRTNEAYDEFFRATWSYNGRTKGYLGVGFISASRGDFIKAFEFAGRALQTESCNQEALALQIFASFRRGCSEASQRLNSALKRYPLNPVLHYLNYAFAGESLDELKAHLNQREINFLSVMEFLLKCGCSAALLSFLELCPACGAVACLCHAALLPAGEKRQSLIAQAEREFASFVRFPNLPFERELIAKVTESAFALHLCACFDYSHRLYQSAAALWQQCLELEPEHVEALRGLAIYSFNKLHDANKARELYAKALSCAPEDERVLFENDLLLKLSGAAPQERLTLLEAHNVQHCTRDDLKAEYVTLLNQTGCIDEAQSELTNRSFHVWEGGEGRVTGQYVVNALLRAARSAQDGDNESALDSVLQGLTFPHNLGEGKLIVQTDNDLYFFAALYAARLGRTGEAQQYLDKAMQGSAAITEQRYYNDLPVDYVFFNALARLVSGKKAEAQDIFSRMKQWSFEAFNQEAQEDFFAVSLPDLVVLDRDLNVERQASCLLMRMLSALGLNDEAAFEESFAALKALQPSNFKLHLYRSLHGLLSVIAAKAQLN